MIYDALNLRRVSQSPSLYSLSSLSVGGAISSLTETRTISAICTIGLFFKYGTFILSYKKKA